MAEEAISTDPAPSQPDNSPLGRLGRLSLQQKLGLGIGLAALIALIVGAWIWGQTPEYRVLYSNLSDRDGGAIIASLQQMNVPYKFAEGGGALLVPANQVHEVRLKLASQGLPKGGNVGFELMENQRFGITQFAEQVNYQRALEGELARSVESIGAVASARVHLAIPKPTVFVKEQQKPSASVILSLQGGRLLDSAQVSAIVHLISSSVPDMSPKNVTVVDQNGTLLSADHNGNLNEGLDANQLKYVQQIEHGYVQRIETLLAPLLGASNLRAQVSADIDFSRSEQTSETFRPNQPPNESAVRSQQISETLNGNGLAASGVPGALTNQPPVPATAPIVSPAPNVNVKPGADLNVSSLQKESTVNYEVDRTIRHTVLPVGAIKRLSAAVVVNDNRTTTDAKGKTVPKPYTDTEKEQISNLIREAMGFDQNRGDSLNVQFAPFAGPEPVEETPLWKQPETLELAKELLKYGLIALIALIIVLRIIKPAFKSLTEPVGETGGFSAAPELVEPEEEGVTYTPSAPGFETALLAAKQLAKDDPKIVASVIKEWVSQ